MEMSQYRLTDKDSLEFVKDFLLLLGSAPGNVSSESSERCWNVGKILDKPAVEVSKS
jgi:hypothetical protein